MNEIAFPVMGEALSLRLNLFLKFDLRLSCFLGLAYLVCRPSKFQMISPIIVSFAFPEENCAYWYKRSIALGIILPKEIHRT
jgi:hypothetical protein